MGDADKEGIGISTLKLKLSISLHHIHVTNSLQRRDSVFLEELVLQSAVHCYRCRTWHRPRL